MCFNIRPIREASELLFIIFIFCYKHGQIKNTNFNLESYEMNSPYRHKDKDSKVKKYNCPQNHNHHNSKYNNKASLDFKGGVSLNIWCQ